LRGRRGAGLEKDVLLSRRKERSLPFILLKKKRRSKKRERGGESTSRIAFSSEEGKKGEKKS